MILFDFGGKIKGDSTYKDHDKWVQVSSAQMGVGMDCFGFGRSSK